MIELTENEIFKSSDYLYNIIHLLKKGDHIKIRRNDWWKGKYLSYEEKLFDVKDLQDYSNPLIYTLLDSEKKMTIRKGILLLHFINGETKEYIPTEEDLTKKCWNVIEEYDKYFTIKVEELNSELIVDAVDERVRSRLLNRQIKYTFKISIYEYFSKSFVCEDIREITLEQRNSYNPFYRGLEFELEDNVECVLETIFDKKLSCFIEIFYKNDYWKNSVNLH